MAGLHHSAQHPGNGEARDKISSRKYLFCKIENTSQHPLPTSKDDEKYQSGNGCPKYIAQLTQPGNGIGEISHCIHDQAKYQRRIFSYLHNQQRLFETEFGCIFRVERYQIFKTGLIFNLLFWGPAAPLSSTSVTTLIFLFFNHLSSVNNQVNPFHSSQSNSGRISPLRLSFPHSRN